MLLLGLIDPDGKNTTKKKNSIGKTSTYVGTDRTGNITNLDDTPAERPNKKLVQNGNRIE